MSDKNTEPPVCPVCKKPYLKHWYHPDFAQEHFIHGYKDEYSIEIGYYQKPISCIQWLFTGERIDSDGNQVRAALPGSKAATPDDLRN